MPSGPSEDDAVQPQWSALLAGLTLTGKLPAEARAVMAIETGSDSVRVVLRHDGYEIERDLDGDADVTLRGAAHLVGGVLSGLLSVAEATRMGLTVDGRADLLADLVDRDRTETGATA
jgi:hypothetical protein